MSRRQFLRAGCAACAGAAGLLLNPDLVRAAGPNRKHKLRIIYALHAVKQSGPDWPNVGFDFGPVMERIHTELTRRCRDFEFTTAQANGPEQAQRLLAEDQAAGLDGYIVYQMNCWNQVVQTIAPSGKPVLYVDYQFAGSGGFLVYTAGFLRNRAPNVGFVASSRMDDVVQAVKCFGPVIERRAPNDFADAVARVRAKQTPGPGRPGCRPDPIRPAPVAEYLGRLKESRILAVRGAESGPAPAMLGIPVELVPFAEVNEAWKEADKDRARAVAEAWRVGARAVVGVSPATLESSAAMYLGMKTVMAKHRANAITVNCLGGFYGGHIHAYPCLGFHALNNEGLIGGCECDVRSAAAMVLVSALTGGRPGYISDPVLDSGKRQIIYAHCVAPNRVFGPEGPANPFEILTHSEDRQGASVRSLMPLGYLTTTVQVSPERKELLFHQGKTVANDPDDRACRTKLCVEPRGDFESLFREWDRWGWHRVTCYGDVKEPLAAVTEALGFKLVTEA